MNEIVTGQDITPMDLLQRAVTSGVDVVVWEKLMGLQERWDANKAHKAYAAAMADAKAEFPPIKKDRVVDFTNRQGQRTYYKFADMATIAEAIDKPLSKHGLTYRFRTVTTAPTVVTVTCVVSHRDGYSEENSLSATADISGNKNAIQAIGSAVTYLQRYTLNAALGLTASEDDDGQAAGTATEEPSSGDEYAARWQKILDDATSHEGLTIQWNAEKMMRNQFEWRGATHANLKAAVTRRIEELKLNATAAGLASQRLNAEDA
jgi:hypothetical protein